MTYSGFKKAFVGLVMFSSFFGVNAQTPKKSNSSPTNSTITKPASGKYSIKIKVNGLKDTVCYLANYYGDKQYLKDTA